MTDAAHRLPVESLCRRFDASALDFERTDEVQDGDQLLGQERAREALDFGIGLRRAGYNLFVVGRHTSDKEELVHGLLGRRAAADGRPSDWCYVFNFDVPSQPNLIRLPAGKGTALADDMRHFVEEARGSLAAAFESEEYQTRLHAIQERFHAEHQSALDDLEKKAQAQGLALLRSPNGFAFFPAKGDGVMPLEEIRALADEERERFEKATESLQEDLLHILRRLPARQRRLREAISSLDREIARLTVQDLVAELRERYAGLEEVQTYVSQVEEDVVTRARDVSGPTRDDRSLIASLQAGREHDTYIRYAVNPLVSHKEGAGPPVVFQDHPTMQNLIGGIEFRSEMGTLVTDFTLINAGSLHESNGGYLLVDAHKLLSQPFSWESLKRTLKRGEVVIRSVHEEIGLIHTVSIEPEPMPIDVKVVLFGEAWLYHLLCELDPEFSELFRVEADFDHRMDRTEENEKGFARLVAFVARNHGLRPLDREAVARVIEHASRCVGDAEKLSAETGELRDLLLEADYTTSTKGRDSITREDVEETIEARRRRRGRVRERVYEDILRGTHLIDTSGAVVGQVNGLTVLQVGRDVFAAPTRITATVQMGKGSVVDIEREVELGGPIHSKGILILSSFLGSRYASDTPLSLSASLVFEQSYGEIDGDSASAGELAGLLSAISAVPVFQSVAVTGSVNQHGTIQPIGGVNEKIEGFFEICRARGLTGDQGVIIPKANAKHLMLRDEVVEAVAAGQFAVYAVEHFDEAMELLTGRSMGLKAEDGTFPEGSLNALIQDRLSELAEERMEYLVVSNGTDTE